MAVKLQFNCTNNMAEYEACILGLKMVIDPRASEYWRHKFVDSSCSRRMGREEPKNYALCAVCIEVVQKTS